MLLVFYLRMILLLLGTLISKVSLYLLIMAYVWMEQPTDASIIFFITSHFSNLQIYFARLLPDSLGKVAEFWTAMSRIKKVLVATEVDSNKNQGESQGPIANPLVQLNNVTVCIDGTEVLSNVDFKTESGLTLITGQVGSGKSCLLKTILQEYGFTGTVVTKGRISYASQNAWLFPSTIRQNILFGEKFNAKRYEEVLRICALQYDLSLFEKGDETILTDNGQNLSKGQQARVNLARAVYKNSDIYLLDDCLSSLDTHVQSFIFNQCIKKFLKNKICILVTQDENRLNDKERILVMKNGSLENQININSSLQSMQMPQESEIEATVTTLITEDDLEISETDKLIEADQMTHKNIYEEKPKEGAVGKEVYRKYIAFGGGFFILLMNLILIGLNQGSESYSAKLLSVWVDEKQNILNIQANISLTDTHKNLRNSTLDIDNLKAASTFKTYSIMLAVSLILELTRTYSFLIFCRRASIMIHKAMVKNILQSVMSFFDTHFIGNILNRFSQDITNIDENLPFQLSSCLGVLFSVGGAVALIASVNGYFFIIAIVFFCTVITFLRLYLPVARNLQRLEASTRSPMLGYLNAALEGMTTIRAYKAEKLVIEEYERYQDVFTSAHYTLLCYQFAFGFFMHMLAALMITLVLLSFILFETEATAGSIGLALTQVIELGSQIAGTVKNWADLENLMTAMERALDYTCLSVESQTGTAFKNWPDKGSISYNKVFLTYNNKQMILNNLNFHVFPKEKIGVVGRTGAGKSSIISTIFRLYEVEGNIAIDGCDIRNIPLKLLRTNLAIIPQDPVLFSGTIRSNLDPFGHHKDEELWNALEKVHLKDFIKELTMKVTGNASNFSLGQKQMICVARAILAKAKIVIMDEATANMDQQTESLIRNTIRENFSECTVLTIAHRLQSILECDRVMVLDRGEIREFDSPRNLVKNENGIFKGMIYKL